MIASHSATSTVTPLRNHRLNSMNSTHRASHTPVSSGSRGGVTPRRTLQTDQATGIEQNETERYIFTYLIQTLCLLAGSDGTIMAGMKRIMMNRRDFKHPLRE